MRAGILNFESWLTSSRKMRLTFSPKFSLGPCAAAAEIELMAVLDRLCLCHSPNLFDVQNGKKPATRLRPTAWPKVKLKICFQLNGETHIRYICDKAANGKGCKRVQSAQDEAPAQIPKVTKKKAGFGSYSWCYAWHCMVYAPWSIVNAPWYCVARHRHRCLVFGRRLRLAKRVANTNNNIR